MMSYRKRSTFVMVLGTSSVLLTVWLLGAVTGPAAAQVKTHAAAQATIGNAVVGKAAFMTAGCGSCHALKAAGSKGTIGPSLDTESLTEAKIIAQITNGGYAVMGASAQKQYPFPMSAFKGKLTTVQIENIAAFVFTKRTGGVPAVTTTTAASSSSSSSSTSASSTTGTVATITAAPPAAAASDGCPAGTTIVQNNPDDHDSDDTGDISDNDGCI
jgi:mono/diheme cytochrome c family protein